MNEWMEGKANQWMDMVRKKKGEGRKGTRLGGTVMNRKGNRDYGRREDRWSGTICSVLRCYELTVADLRLECHRYGVLAA